MKQPASSSVPRVSVCLLVYNHERLLRDTVLTVLRQTLSDFELIISDDCSTDGTPEVIAQLAAEDPRVRAIRTPRNLGMPGNANYAVSRAYAPYIALLHHDDLYEPHLLQSWFELAERHPSVTFVSNAYRNHGRGDELFHPISECHDGRDVLERLIFPFWGCPIRGTALVRRTAWDAVGGMRERFGLLADVDLWMRLAALGDVGYVHDILINIRQERPDNYPKDYSGWSWPRLRLLYEIHGTNRREYFGLNTFKGRWEQAKYRLRVSANELMWLGYGIVKRRPDILRSSHQIANEFELPPAIVARRLLQVLTQLRAT